MNFTLLLFIALGITGAVWVGVRVAERIQGTSPENRNGWLDLLSSLFPVILIVLAIRSFVVEPFKIPSASMLPTLQVGDFILVNKFEYGLRLPLAGWRLTDGDSPQRGDVIVFEYPRDESVDYIKRIVALPGDRIAFRDRHLFVNGEKVPLEFQDHYTYRTAGGRLVRAKRFQERMVAHSYRILYTEDASNREVASPVRIPEGEYFVMGDNRNNSKDSRYWGTVPAENILGKAVVIWWSWDGYRTHPRWNRLGQWIP